jgi:hypothetical protein
MQIPVENGGERDWIETQVAVGTFHDEAEPAVQISPLRSRKIGIRQRDAVCAVAHPIHQAQRASSDGIKQHNVGRLESSRGTGWLL